MKHITDIIIRHPAPSIAQSAEPLRGIPDYARASLQHQNLVAEIAKTGARIVPLDTAATLPDASLIDDIAVVTETIAVLARMGNQSPRTAEQQALANLLAQDRILKFISPPGLMCGRDVLRIGNHFFIGLSDRTNEEGAAQLAFFLKEFGYDATTLVIESGNGHLKNAAAVLPDGRIVIREDMARHYAFLGFEKIVIDTNDAAACTGIALDGIYFMPAGLAVAARILRDAGISVCEVNVSEFEKTGAGLASLILPLPRILRETTSIVLPLKSSHKIAA